MPTARSRSVSSSTGLTVGLFLWCWRLFVTGYRLKS
jgi:hypothetical protein